MYVARHSATSQNRQQRANESHRKVCDQMDNLGTLHRQLQQMVRSSQLAAPVSSTKAAVRTRYIPAANALMLDPQAQQRADRHLESRFYGELQCSLLI